MLCLVKIVFFFLKHGSDPQLKWLYRREYNQVKVKKMWEYNELKVKKMWEYNELKVRKMWEYNELKVVLLLNNN